MIQNKTYRGFLLLFVLLGVVSCTSKMVYNNLDWLASWYIDDYVTLTDIQEAEFDPVLTQFLDWHRQSELQNYVDQIKRIQFDINNGAEEADIEGHMRAFKGFWLSIITRAEPDIVKLAYSLSDEQVEEFLAASEQRNLDKVEDHDDSSKEERLDDRLDRIEDQFSSFIGKLTPSQKQLLKTTNEALLSTFDEWIAFRRAWANSIRVAYTKRDDKAAFEEALSHSILQADSWRSEEYWRKIEHNQNVWVATIEELIASLNRKQLKKLNGKLDDAVEDLEALIKSG